MESEGFVYVFGGALAESVFTSQVWRFDLATGKCISATSKSINIRKRT